MLPLNTHARVTGVSGTAILKVLTLAEAQRSDIEPLRCLVWHQSSKDAPPLRFSDEWAGIVSPDAVANHEGRMIVVDNIKNRNVIAPGDSVCKASQIERASGLFFSRLSLFNDRAVSSKSTGSTG